MPLNFFFFGNKVFFNYEIERLIDKKKDAKFIVRISSNDFLPNRTQFISSVFQ